MSHGMDIDTYEREIMQPEDWPYEIVPEPSLRYVHFRTEFPGTEKSFQ
jgi:hypothetical protein